MKNVFLGLALIVCTFCSVAQAAPVLTNGDFTNGLTGWTTQNSGDGDDTSVVWIIENPSGSNQVSNNGRSSGPASRVFYQDFVVPANGVSSASFDFEYYATNSQALNSSAFTTFENNPFGGNNGTRIDIMATTSDIFTGPVLFSLFSPDDAVPVGTPVAPVVMSFADVTGLVAFLDANAGSTLRLRIGNKEETFPWDTGFDNFNLDIEELVAAPAPPAPAEPVPTLSEWAIMLLALLMIGVVLVRRGCRQVNCRSW